MKTKRKSTRRKRPPPAAVPNHTRIEGLLLKNDHPLVRATHRTDVKITDALRKARLRELETPLGKGHWSDAHYEQARAILTASYPLSDAQREQASELIARSQRKAGGQ